MGETHRDVLGRRLCTRSCSGVGFGQPLDPDEVHDVHISFQTLLAQGRGCCLGRTSHGWSSAVSIHDSQRMR
jgi:hypothetical protein